MPSHSGGQFRRQPSVTHPLNNLLREAAVIGTVKRATDDLASSGDGQFSNLMANLGQGSVTLTLNLGRRPLTHALDFFTRRRERRLAVGFRRLARLRDNTAPGPTPDSAGPAVPPALRCLGIGPCRAFKVVFDLLLTLVHHRKDRLVKGKVKQSIENDEVQSRP